MSVDTNSMQRGYDVVIARINQYVLWVSIRVISDSVKIQNKYNTIIIVFFRQVLFCILSMRFVENLFNRTFFD
jgi:hypothetical protein